MDDLEAAVKTHRFIRNRRRTNVRPREESIQGHWKRRYLAHGVLSNTLREGRILDLCRELLGPQINRVTVNKNLCCHPHRDKANDDDSYICWFGDFTGGALCLETGERFEGKRKWFKFNGKTTTHWNEEHEGGKFACVAYS